MLYESLRATNATVMYLFLEIFMKRVLLSIAFATSAFLETSNAVIGRGIVFIGDKENPLMQNIKLKELSPEQSERVGQSLVKIVRLSLRVKRLHDESRELIASDGTLNDRTIGRELGILPIARFSFFWDKILRDVLLLLYAFAIDLDPELRTELRPYNISLVLPVSEDDARGRCAALLYRLENWPNFRQSELQLYEQLHHKCGAAPIQEAVPDIDDIVASCARDLAFLSVLLQGPSIWQRGFAWFMQLGLFPSIIKNALIHTG